MFQHKLEITPAFKAVCKKEFKGINVRFKKMHAYRYQIIPNLGYRNTEVKIWMIDVPVNKRTRFFALRYASSLYSEESGQIFDLKNFSKHFIPITGPDVAA